jgi:hypothetical protein
VNRTEGANFDGQRFKNWIMGPNSGMAGGILRWNGSGLGGNRFGWYTRMKGIAGGGPTLEVKSWKGGFDQRVGPEYCPLKHRTVFGFSNIHKPRIRFNQAD